MSQENVKIVREVMDLMNLSQASGGEENPRLIELSAPDARIGMSRRVFNPDVYEGHAGLRRLIREAREVWESFWVTPERFIEASDRVVVIETRRGRGRESGVEVEDRSAVIWTIRDDRVIDVQTDLDPKE